MEGNKTLTNEQGDLKDSWENSEDEQKDLLDERTIQPGNQTRLTEEKQENSIKELEKSEGEQGIDLEGQNNVILNVRPEKVFCAKCGTEIINGQSFCPKCGQKVEGLEISSETKKINKRKSKKKVIAIVVGAATAVIIALVVVFAIRGVQVKSVTLSEESVTVKVGEKISVSYLIDPDNSKDKTVIWTSSDESIAKVVDGTISGVNQGDCTISIATNNGKTDTCQVKVLKPKPNLKALYNKYCEYEFAELGSDDSYLSVDTNPYDSDSEYLQYVYFSEALNAIKNINKALELPESVLNRMEQTRGLDGTQSYETDDLEITWTFHPDNGLEVNYSLK